MMAEKIKEFISKIGLWTGSKAINGRNWYPVETNVICLCKKIKAMKLIDTLKKNKIYGYLKANGFTLSYSYMENKETKRRKHFLVLKDSVESFLFELKD